MIRATLNMKESADMIWAYKYINQIEEINIIKIDNNLCSSASNVIFNFIYKDMIIGEIVINYGTKPLHYDAN